MRRASVERAHAPDDRSNGQIVLIYQLGVIRVDFAIEQFPVEGVHRRGGWCVSGQDRGHRRSHVGRDTASRALECALVTGDGVAAGRYRYHPGVDKRRPDSRVSGATALCGGW